MIRILLLVCATLLSTTSWAETNLYGVSTPEYDGKLSDPRHFPMPPALNAESDPETALRDYPLGVIPKRVAFYHHGSPHKTVTLANGKEGWVYEIPHKRTRKSYMLPSGDRVNVREIPANAVMHTFTLAFDDGVVIDVIYKDDGPGTGVTATEMQAHKAQPMVESPPFRWTPP